MSYHRLPAFTPPSELIGFGNGLMASAETSEQTMLSALQAILRDYESVEISHQDFRVKAAQLANAAIAKVSARAADFPKPQRRESKEPCGECHLKAEKTYLGVPISDIEKSGAFVWHPGDEA